MENRPSHQSIGSLERASLPRSLASLPKPPPNRPLHRCGQRTIGVRSRFTFGPRREDPGEPGEGGVVSVPGQGKLSPGEKGQGRRTNGMPVAPLVNLAERGAKYRIAWGLAKVVQKR